MSNQNTNSAEETDKLNTDNRISTSTIKQIIKNNSTENDTDGVDQITVIAGYNNADDEPVTDLVRFNKTKRSLFTKRSRKGPLDGVALEDITYKDPALLKQCISDHGKIMSCRLICTTAKQQRKLREQIKIARIMNLMSFIKK